ncbi:transposase [Candidatus Daviesbacteria bacterium RIFCSPHIGHO2_12_FULL_47_45]|nr:MAG: transposase [Candidatus Daviesbacteria bacterium RIFCSPHIGHO2_12_FULL_47_45]
MKRYKHLDIFERETLSQLLFRGGSLTDIAKVMGRDKSTLSREISKCRLGRFGYRALTAQALVEQRTHLPKRPKKILNNPLLESEIFKYLRMKWSPEQIANRLKMEYPNEPSMQISHESIYTYLFCLPKGELRKELLSYLRQHIRTRRKRQNTHSKRGQIPNMISIEERPQEVEPRIIPGHWEGDLIIGKDHASALGTLVERTTRATLLVPLKERDAKSVRRAFQREVRKLPKQMKLSLTYDRGKEMSEHQLFTKNTKVQVYFAHPQSPWERGTNENTNGLLRQYFPKGKTDFNKLTRKEIKRIQNQLNGRPRKVLNWYTPFEVFDSLLH